MEPDGSLQQQKVAVGGGGGAGGGRSKLSLRRKKDKDAPTQQHPSPPPPNPTHLSLRITPCDILTVITPKASNTTSRTTHSGESDRDLDTSTHDNMTAPTRMKKLKPVGTSIDVEYVPLDEGGEEVGTDDERTEMELQHVSSPHLADVNDDDNEGLGGFYFCHICQKDLTRFSESRRQTHINRCCDKQEEEESVAAATARESQSSPFACLLCEKSFKSDNVRVVIITEIASSPGPSQLSIVASGHGHFQAFNDYVAALISWEFTW